MCRYVGVHIIDVSVLRQYAVMPLRHHVTSVNQDYYQPCMQLNTVKTKR